MSKGSPLVAFRIKADLLFKLEAYLGEREQRCYRNPMNRSEFIIAAITEKLHHLARSRRRRASHRYGEKFPCPPTESQDSKEPQLADDGNKG